MYIKIFITMLMVTFCSISIADELNLSTYETLIDAEGNISLPENFRENWTFLGTWSIAEKDVQQSGDASNHGAAGLHNVYTQNGVAGYFRENGEFPDGAVLIKELLKTETASMTTGTVSRGKEVEGWFIMIKDTQQRFSSNPLWGDGWGWALFNTDQTNLPVTKSYKSECLGCHIPARGDDWIYISGYPILSSSN